MTAWKEKMPTFPAGVHLVGKTSAIVRAGREDDRRETEGLWNKMGMKVLAKMLLAAFVLLKDGKKGLRSPWFPTAFPKVGWGPLNAQFYWSGFRQWTHKKRPGHYRNGLAHFPYSVWYLKYVFSTRDLVLTCQCDHKSSWFHEEVVSFMFFFAYLLFRVSSLALMCVPPHWAYLMAMNKKALGLGRFGKWHKWTQIWWFLVMIKWWWRWVL